MSTHPEHPAAHDSSHDVVSDNERTAWLVPTAVLGGIGALLLLGAGGATAAASLSVQEHRVDTTVTESVDTVVVDSRSAVVEVVTADIPDLRVESVYAGFRLESAPEPRVEDGRLSIDALPSRSWPGAGSGMHVRITVPAGNEPVDLRLSGDAGALSVEGDFGDVRLDTEAGVIEASGSARTLWASSEVGAVDLDGIRVREDLDVHTEVGATEVRLVGEAPRRVAVTTRAGAVEAAVPDADWWTPAVAGADDRDPEDLTAATVCAAVPDDRPCLYVASAVGAAEITYGGRSAAPGSGASGR
ncbi:hypothetical protein CIK52_04640 [Kocuria rosea]|uniref:hypothetical protein n=1 Tax=Kocuria rosea TaxID=1275 RepID=UPI000D654D6E|nr:hypothetical protein [Kocuria rosea]PWF87119.1 hypothetical protein CIK52_04640 [Kocuria rosea]QCY34122.1 hypothetical protein EQG70_15595 [Kocuria rosea]TQN38340.1 hypothetical protein FHX38_0160 [Kocuria rosea]VEI50969.1 Uncharacterised protein [Kocuria rosea]